MMNQTQKHTTGKKLLALLLALIMAVSLLPMSVFATEADAEPDQNVEQSTEPAAEEATVEPGQNEGEAAEEPAADPAETVADPQAMVKEAAAVYDAATDATLQYRIVHLDCGRKYFTKNWIIALLYEMKAAGYNQLQLAFGNDGLRFLLKDMTFTANGTTYAHKDVVEKVEAGNAAQNSSGDGRWLTQTEMDAIIARANELDIAIVPLLNLPGHANAIANIDGTYKFSTSEGTLNVTDSTNAQNFALAILQKYVDYFAGKGCRFFNFGADEYANDITITGNPYYGNLSSNQYSNLISFINAMATCIKDAGMTPRAFNDSMYYKTLTSTTVLDTGIQCCYWSSGWSGYDVASAATISGKGHAMINTNGDFYYVLGKNDAFTPNTTTTHDPNLYTAASTFSNTSFMGGNISNPIGSMFCIWCDYPNAETETQVAANVRLVLRAMAQRMNNETLNVSEEVVANGFNADGTLNAGGTETPDLIALPANDKGTGADVVVKGLAGQTATVTVEAIAARTEGLPKDAEAVSYNVTPAVDDTAYTGEGTVTLPVPSVWVNSSDRIRGYIVTDGNVETITGTYDAVSGKYTFSVPHFSEMGLLLLADSSVEVTNNETITVTVGQTATDTISGANYAGTYTTEDPSIATVEVTGVDAVEATTTYTKASVTCNTLISSNANNWTAVSGYYYKADDGNYYPVYAKRSSSWSWSSWSYTYTYTWGYSTTNSTGNVTQIGTQSTTDTSTTPNITVYTQSETEGAPASTTVTFTGVAVGTTYVTVGNTRYTINVTVSPLTVEYWITNGRPTDEAGKDFYTVNASDPGVYSADGFALAERVPGNTTKENRTLLFWRGRLLDKTLDNSSTSGTEEQTENEGDDDTYNGVEFTKVRYWDGKWSVYTENNEWVDVSEDHQLVAYYLEILPISDELTVTAADWGKKGDGSTSGDYLDPLSSCTVSVQVVYEDGTTNPATTTAADLKSRTIAYGYWENGRGIGTLNLVALEGYQIWKIEAETGAETYASSSSTWGSYTVNSFTWDNNPMTVYEGDAVDQYILHNDANNPSTDGYYENLMWDENHEAILIKVYLKAVAQEDSLTVNYFVQGESSPFYSYAINVNAGTTFDSGFAWQKDASAKGGAKLVNNTVVNSLGVTQTVQSDLSLMPQISAQYRYSDYKFVAADRSTDGKTVNLYYTFNSSKTFVVDFGLPLVIRPTDMSEGLISDKLTIDINPTTTYANITTDGQCNITYKLKQTIDGQDNFGVKYTGEIATAEGTQYDSVEYSITIIPASTVYYEDSFVTFYDAGNDTAKIAFESTSATDEMGVWYYDGASANSSPDQALEELWQKTNVYGYDPAYDNCTTFSMGSAKKVTVNSDTYKVNSAWPTATFTFKGTGFDVISLTSNTSGTFFVTVTNKSSGEVVRKNTIDTYYGYHKDESGNWVAAENTPNALYQIPVMKIKGLDYAEYDVEIKVAYASFLDHTNSSSYSFWLDAIRVYDPMGKDQNYGTDNETSPDYVELRQVLVDANSLGNSGAVFIDGNANETIITNYANYGPNHEVYLANNQAIAFKLIANAEPVGVQLAAKQLTGDNATLTVSGTKIGKHGDAAGTTLTLTSGTDMYYELSDIQWTVNTQGLYETNVITLTNSGESGIVALTNLKFIGAKYTTDTASVTNAASDEVLVAMMMMDAAAAEKAVAAVDSVLYPQEVKTFTPERFEASWNRSTVKVGQKATLTVKTSEDVEAVMVDGVTIDTYRTRTQRTGWGQNATKVTYREFTYTITAAETADYAITAVDAEGIASEPITATLTVQAASQRPGFGGWLDTIFGRWF